MNNEEIQSLIEQLKAQGLDDEKIMNVFYEAFLQGEMDREDLETLAEAMGYELTDDFKNDSTPDPIALGGEEGAEGASEEQDPEEKLKDPLDINEDAGEEKEEKEEEEPEAKEEGESEDKDEDEPEEEEDEDEEWEKAQKLFKI